MALLKPQGLLRRALLFFCFTFVVYRSGRCILKFLDNPTGIDLSLEDGTGEKFPQFTFCVDLNESVLNDCGITLDEYKDEGVWSNVDGPNYCKSPKKLLESSRVSLETMVPKTRVSYDSEDNAFIDLYDTRFWTLADDPTGTCYIFNIPPKLLVHSVREIRFYLGKNAYKLFITSPGYLFANPRRASYRFHKFFSQEFFMDYNIFHELSHLREQCIEDDTYSIDECNRQQAFEKMMEELNCTWPLFENKDHICMDVNSSKKALEIGEKYYKKHVQRCKWPCKYLRTMIDGLVKQKLKEELHVSFIFKPNVKVFKSFYVYNELSLIAEIGGYVGLFLGWSVYQLSDTFERLIKRF